LVPERILTLEPDAGQRGAVVIVKGTGFAAKNSFPISSYRVDLDYSGTRLTSVTPDSEGKFEVSFAVPYEVLIPSQNTVTATITGVNANAVATHDVPAAVITLSPESGSPGSHITLIGYNFPTFTSLSNLTMGPVIVLPATGAITDRLGSFTAVFVVPQYEPGVQVIQATMPGVWASETFIVSSAAVGPTGEQRPLDHPAVLLDPVIARSNLVRMWQFNNATKGWTFFDPQPGFKDANTIFRISKGEIYWVNVADTQLVTLNGRLRELSGGWNLIIW